MNEENQMINAREGGLSPVAQSQNSAGLGSIQDSGFKRNSSLELFELANAEKNRAKEMQYENEAMKAKAAQQILASEANAIKEAQIIEGLKNGQIDEETAFSIFADDSISKPVKQAVADVFYPRAYQEKYGSYVEPSAEQFNRQELAQKTGY